MDFNVPNFAHYTYTSFDQINDLSFRVAKKMNRANWTHCTEKPQKYSTFSKGQWKEVICYAILHMPSYFT